MAISNLLPPGATSQAITLANWMARKAVKAEWRKQGIKLQQFDARDIAKATKAHLSEHPELIEQAQARLCKS